MTERIGVTAYPLYWPIGRARTKFRKPANFRESNVYRESQFVRAELERLRARKVVISSNLQLRQDGIPYAGQKIPADPGVSIWFGLRQGEKWVEHALSCDCWDRAEDNLRAIGKHVEAMRGQLRWGVGSVAQAFAGYAAIPARATSRPAHEVLGLDGTTLNREEIERAFKRRALECHPDRGGSPESWHELQQAREFMLAAAR